MRGFAKLAAGAAFVIAAGLTVGSCVGLDGRSQAQIAYDACSSTYNSNRLSLETEWAFVAGVGDFETSCFWAWGRESAEAAYSAASSNCRKEYSNCFGFADSFSGFQQWVQRISDNGGSDGSGGGDTFGDMVNLGVSGVQLYNAIQGNGTNGGTVGGYNGSVNGYSNGGGGGATGGQNCQPYYDAYLQCQQRQQNMTSLGNVPLGANGCVQGALSCSNAGQAGSFEDCAANYYGAYETCMAMQ